MTEPDPIPRPVEGIACECGGVYRRAVLERYDFSEYIGFEVTLSGFEGLRCDKCGDETLDGRLINIVMNHTVVQVTRQPRRLSGPEARYLRHHLAATQEELATRMGIDRVTVAKWECGDSTISTQHDYLLRGITLSSLMTLGLLPMEMARQIMVDIFGAVRSSPPSKALAAIAVAQGDIGVMVNPTAANNAETVPQPRAATG